MNQKAVLGGIKLRILASPGITDSYESAVITHEYPRQNGAKLENMGLRAKRISFTAVFYGSSEYANHIKLVEILKKQELIDFIHPKYGLLKGMVEIFSVSQDESENFARVDITFVEDRISTRATILYEEDVNEAAKKKVGIILEQTLSETEKQIKDDTGEDGLSIVDKVLDFTQSVISQFPDVTGTLRYYVKEVDRLMVAVDSGISQITNPVNSIINTIDFGTTLSGRIIKSIAQLAERVSLLIEDFGDAPEDFIQNYRNQMLILEESMGIDAGTLGGITAGSTQKMKYERSAKDIVAETLKIAGSSFAAIKLAEIYASDDENRRKITQAEQKKTFDANGKYLGSGEEYQPIMTVQEIEKSLAAAREYIQEAIDLNRNINSLPELALTLLRNVNDIKIEMELIETNVEIGNNPLFLIMLKKGLPYNMIDRIIALNPDKPNPSFYTGEMNLYAA